MTATKLTSLLVSSSIFLSLGLSACDTETLMPYCEDSVTVLESLDEPTPAGLSPAELLAMVEGERPSVLEYVEAPSDGVQVEVAPGGEGSTELSLELLRRAGGEIRWIDSQEVQPAGNGPVAAIAIECPNRIEIDAELSFESADGAFAEVFEVVVSAAVDSWGEAGEAGEINLARVHQDFDPSLLAGALEVIAISPNDYDRVDYHIELSYPLSEGAAGEDGDIGLPSGSIAGGAEYSSGSGEDGVVSYAMFELGRVFAASGDEDE